MLERMTGKARAALLWAASNVTLFVFTAFLVTGVLCMEPMVWYREQVDLVNQYVVFPWGIALCLLRMERRSRDKLALRPDVAVQCALLLWCIVPFALRFGLTRNNIGTWYNHAVAYFGIYAFLREKPAMERERLFDLMIGLCGALAFLLSGGLLYCAATAQTIYHGAQETGFGLWNGMHLTYGVHYNFAGAMLVSLAMLSLAGVSRMKRWPLRAFFAVTAAMAILAAVLTQSRTARYASIIVLSVGTYGVIMGRMTMKRRAVQHLAAIAAAALVMVGLYAGAAKLTDAALLHYATVESARAQGETVGLTDVAADAIIPPAVAEETGAGEIKPLEAREAVDATFSDRTTIWKNLFALWKDNPRHMIIGNGVGRTGSRVVAGTIHEEAGAVQLHNTYLQHTADFGLIGTMLIAAFFALLVRPMWRVFFARGDRRKGGYTAMIMLVLAALATGMMESGALGAFSPLNMLMVFALALLAGRGDDLGALVK